MHLKRICSAIDVLTPDIDFGVYAAHGGLNLRGLQRIEVAAHRGLLLIEACSS
jgi:hypothetical protein